MDDPSRYHWYGEEPFPWIGIGMGTLLGLGLAVVAPWLIFNLRDVNLLKDRP